jgi:hypothetical protein
MKVSCYTSLFSAGGAGWGERAKGRHGDAARGREGDGDCVNGSIVPVETDISFCVLSRHFVPGYFRKVPPGLMLPKDTAGARESAASTFSFNQ